MEIMCCGGGEGNLAMLVRNFPQGCQGIEDLVNTLRGPRVKRIIEQNTYLHLSRIKKGINDLRNTHKGQTAFIVGSSPSLVKHIPLLNELKKKDKTFIIAINDSLELLKQNANYYFLVDYIAKHEWYCDIAPETRENVKLITSIQTPIEVLDYFPDYYHFVGYNARTQINQTFGYLGRIDHAFTSTFSAIHFAYLLGAKRIIFVGQDFAYVNNFNHWNEPLSYDWAKRNKCYTVPDIFGNAVLSDDRLIRNKDCIKGACIFLEEIGIECINATEGGILDINCMPLLDVIEYINKEIKL